MKRKLIIAAAALVAASLTGCATAPLSYQRYASTENLQAQAMAEGVVIRTMPIKIRETANQAANGTLGLVGGGVVGYALGSSPIAAVAGAVGGAILGHTLTPSTVAGTEVMVRLTDGQMLGIPEVGKPDLHAGERVAVLRGADGNTRAVPLGQVASVPPVNRQSMKAGTARP